MMGLTCEKVGCTNEARWMPVLMLRAPYGRPRSHMASPAIMALAVCDDHSRSMRVEEVLSDDAWQKVKRAFAEAGKYCPDRTRTALEWRPLDDPSYEVQAMLQPILERQRRTVGLM
jgi:hypothetical protein